MSLSDQDCACGKLATTRTYTVSGQIGSILTARAPIRFSALTPESKSTIRPFP